MITLELTWSVKFRALGITFGTYSDHKSFPLPELSMIAHTLYTYSDHGINIQLEIKRSHV